jgi:hypothetical protein
MPTVRFRIDPQTDDILSFIAAQKDTSKALLAREILLQGLNEVLFPMLAQLYQGGKISVKQIIALTNLRPVEVLEKLAATIDHSPITPEIADYTRDVADQVIQYLQDQRATSDEGDADI